MCMLHFLIMFLQIDGYACVPFIGEKGRKWALSKEAGFTSEIMAERITEGFEETLKNFKPKSKFTFSSDTDSNKKVLNHKLIY